MNGGEQISLVDRWLLATALIKVTLWGPTCPAGTPRVSRASWGEGARMGRRTAFFSALLIFVSLLVKPCLLCGPLSAPSGYVFCATQSCRMSNSLKLLIIFAWLQRKPKHSGGQNPARSFRCGQCRPLNSPLLQWSLVEDNLMEITEWMVHGSAHLQCRWLRLLSCL